MKEFDIVLGNDNNEEYHQMFYESLIDVHKKMKSDPSEIFVLFEQIKKDMLSKGYNEEQSKNTAYVMLAFPYLGKEVIDEEEITKTYLKIKNIIEHGVFQW
jgi:hypothetical protein